jgi:hypothetical protein
LRSMRFPGKPGRLRETFDSDCAAGPFRVIIRM